MPESGYADSFQKFFRPTDKIFFCISALFLFYNFYASPSFALNSPQRYYDWGPYYSDSGLKVLGVSVSPNQSESTPPAQFRGVQDVAQFKGYFLGFGFGVNPGSPLYFLKKAQESLVLGLTFDPVKKNDLQIQIAGQRLAELEKLAGTNQIKLMTGSSADYQKTMTAATASLNRLSSNSSSSQERLKQIDEESTKHSLVLEQVLARAPESNKAGLAQALAASDKVSDSVADLSGKAALPLEVLDRIQALKSQGLLSPEEAQKLVSITSRVEARAELQKFANEGIFPQADINKLGELAKEKYAQTYNQVVELKKLQELKKLEGEKPSPEIVGKVQEFAKNYKVGDQVPPDLRRYWVPLVRLEELQNTIRPDLIDENSVKSQAEDYKKYQEVVDRLKPRPEDVAQAEKLASRNPNAASDPFYQRIINLAEKFGTSEGGTQVPGVPTAFKSCPGNSHWVAMNYVPDGGYCVPNITYVPYQPQPSEGSNKSTAVAPESVCPSKYHRNYSSGPCLPDAYFGSPVNYPTYTPGSYPSPVYPSTGCPNGYFWSGTSCSQQSSEKNQSQAPSRESQEANCKAGGGTCVSWVNGACGCERSVQPAGTGGSGGVSSGSCSAGQNWVPEPSNPRGGYCANNSNPYPSYNGGSPSRESQEAACRSGGGTCVSWVNGACGCERPGGTNNNAGGSPPPPSGYGSCPSDQYWNGSSCVSNTYTTPASSESPEQACLRGTNCSWTGSSCNCSPSLPPPSSEPSPTPTPPPSDSGGGSSCSPGQYWNGTACVSSQ